MVVFLTEQGLRVTRRGERLSLEWRGQLREEIRLRELDCVMAFGQINFTAPALHALLKKGIDLFFFSASGKYRGKLSSPSCRNNVHLRLRQFALYHHGSKRLVLARTIIRAKIHNQRTLLLRRARLSERQREIAHQLKELAERTEKMKTIDELRGLEGWASRLYFSALKEVLASSPYSFEGRRYYPPSDPVNALLSLGYSLLFSRLWGLVEGAGFDPFLGFVHGPDYGKPSLPLDLMEEWRPVVVDSLVIKLINLRILKPEDFQEDLEGPEEEHPSVVRLTREGLRKFLAHFQEHWLQKVYYPLYGKKFTLFDALREQVYQFARVVRGDLPEYQPFVWQTT